MFKVGLISLALFVCLIGVTAVLDALHVVVFGPCIGPGGLTLYLALMLTSGLGVLLVSVGSVVWTVKRIRSRALHS